MFLLSLCPRWTQTGRVYCWSSSPSSLLSLGPKVSWPGGQGGECKALMAQSAIDNFQLLGKGFAKESQPIVVKDGFDIGFAEAAALHDPDHLL